MSITAPHDVAAVPADAEVTGSGLASRQLSPGHADSQRPGAADRVKVHYSGWTTDGNLFDSSVVRGEPIEFNLNQVIKGWTEGLQLMQIAEKRRFWIPAELAYGTNPPAGAPKGMLVFDVELLDFQTPPAPPEPPQDLADPQGELDITASGIKSRVLKAGDGSTYPKAASVVQVHYSGWMLDGSLFDSSLMRGEPTGFPLNRVIPGWTEALQLMSVGETRQMWIPAELAYGTNPPPGYPRGTLMFEVQLLAILA